MLNVNVDSDRHDNMIKELLQSLQFCAQCGTPLTYNYVKDSVLNMIKEDVICHKCRLIFGDEMYRVH